MVTVGFVVEGPSDKKLVESESFQAWKSMDWTWYSPSWMREPMVGCVAARSLLISRS